MKRYGCLGCGLLVCGLVLLALLTCRFFGLPLAPDPIGGPAPRGQPSDLHGVAQVVNDRPLTAHPHRHQVNAPGQVGGLVLL